jgi:hypothetical protein
MREANSGIALTPPELPIRRSLDSRLNLARKAGARILEGALTQSIRNVRRVPGSVGEKKSAVDLVCAKTIRCGVGRSRYIICGPTACRGDFP